MLSNKLKIIPYLACLAKRNAGKTFKLNNSKIRREKEVVILRVSIHCLFSLAPRPLHYVQVQDGKTYNGLYRPGDMLITPANIPLFVRWEGEENCLQIRLTAEFLQNVARETLNQDCDRLELLPEFQVRDQPMEAIAMMLLTEWQQGPSGSQLYLDSLANVLAVNLLRQHTNNEAAGAYLRRRLNTTSTPACFGLH